MKIHVVGNDIDTDQLAPGKYMHGGIETLAVHCLEPVHPEFARSVSPGDVLVAGTNFGMGSSREQAAEALKHLGIVAVVAKSFAGIFYRNAINLGLPAITADDLADIKNGEQGELDLERFTLTLTGSGRVIVLDPIPEELRKILNAGGLVAMLKRRFEKVER